MVVWGMGVKTRVRRLEVPWVPLVSTRSWDLVRMANSPPSSQDEELLECRTVFKKGRKEGHQQDRLYRLTPPAHSTLTLMTWFRDRNEAGGGRDGLQPVIISGIIITSRIISPISFP